MVPYHMDAAVPNYTRTIAGDGPSLLRNHMCLHRYPIPQDREEEPQDREKTRAGDVDVDDSLCVLNTSNPQLHGALESLSE